MIFPGPGKSPPSSLHMNALHISPRDRRLKTLGSRQKDLKLPSSLRCGIGRKNVQHPSSLTDDIVYLLLELLLHPSYSFTIHRFHGSIVLDQPAILILICMYSSHSTLGRRA